MGLFSKKEDFSVITEKIRNSPLTSNLTELFSDFLSNGGEYYEYLIADSKSRTVKLLFGLNEIRVDFYQIVKTGIFKMEDQIQNTMCSSLGQLGYSDFPNDRYSLCLRDEIMLKLKEQYENMYVFTSSFWSDYGNNVILSKDYQSIEIKIKENAKAQW